MLWGTHYRPGRRIPEATHSKTRRKASPGPSGRLQVAMAFSQISSRGCSVSQINSYSEHITKLEKKTLLASSALNVTHPSFDRLPLWPSVAHVSENPHDDDAGLEVCDSGLKEQTLSQCRQEEHLSQTACCCFNYSKWKLRFLIYKCPSGPLIYAKFSLPCNCEMHWNYFTNILWMLHWR